MLRVGSRTTTDMLRFAPRAPFRAFFVLVALRRYVPRPSFVDHSAMSIIASLAFLASLLNVRSARCYRFHS